VSIEDAVYARLTAVAGVTALIATRVYPVRVPQNPTYPLASYQKISDVPAHAMGSDAGVRTARVQVTAWGATYDDAKNVAIQVVAALSRFRGTSASVVVQDVFFENEVDLGFDAEALVHQVADDFFVYYAG
jgi:hypothetical protein